jgi:Glutaredoxin-like domain (DUF836)
VRVFEVYSRRGCHLCEILIEELALQLAGRARYRVHDVDMSPEWQARYGTEIPVVELDGRELCRHRLDCEAIAAALAAGR